MYGVFTTDMGAYVNDGSSLANCQETVVSWVVHVWTLKLEAHQILTYETAELV